MMQNIIVYIAMSLAFTIMNCTFANKFRLGKTWIGASALLDGPILAATSQTTLDGVCEVGVIIQDSLLRPISTNPIRLFHQLCFRLNNKHFKWPHFPLC
jgi:hypothetical protein